MADTYDKLNCGNCGYDGGRKHLEQISDLEKRLADAESVSDDTRQTRAMALAVFACVACVCGVFAWNISHPDPLMPPPTDAAVQAASYEKMYQYCTNTVANLQRDSQAQALEDCNTSFRQKAQAVKLPAAEATIRPPTPEVVPIKE